MNDANNGAVFDLLIRPGIMSFLVRISGGVGVECLERVSGR